jgi:hypothetical protein
VVEVKNKEIKVAEFTPGEVNTSSRSSTIPHYSKDLSAQQSPDELKNPQHGIRCNWSASSKWKKVLYKGELADDCIVVLERLNFLMRNPDLIPLYQLFDCNCECVAVWCKTGKFTTHQVAIFLNAGVGAAIGLAFTPVSVSVPAAGLWGWFGFTTTRTACILGLAPEICLAIGAITSAFWISMHLKWRKTEEKLNSEFIRYCLRMETI